MSPDKCQNECPNVLEVVRAYQFKYFARHWMLTQVVSYFTVAKVLIGKRNGIIKFLPLRQANTS
jgi:hypothetical protein